MSASGRGDGDGCAGRAGTPSGAKSERERERERERQRAREGRPNEPALLRSQLHRHKSRFCVINSFSTTIHSGLGKRPVEKWREDTVQRMNALRRQKGGDPFDPNGISRP